MYRRSLTRRGRHKCHMSRGTSFTFTQTTILHSIGLVRSREAGPGVRTGPCLCLFLQVEYGSNATVLVNRSLICIGAWMIPFLKNSFDFLPNSMDDIFEFLFHLQNSLPTSVNYSHCLRCWLSGHSRFLCWSRKLKPNPRLRAVHTTVHQLINLKYTKNNQQIICSHCTCGNKPILQVMSRCKQVVISRPIHM